jgi:acyl-CoA reductase-like NAD-dependent aldehyde dehydrogenase
MSATTASDGLRQLGHLIDGRIVRGERTFPVDNPKTGRVVAECPDTTSEMMDEAMAAATRAQPGWHSLGEDGRRVVLRRMVAALADRVDEVAALSELEKGGKQAGYEVQFTPMFVEQMISTPLPVDVIEDTDERTVRVVRRPVGVVAAISPWNAPILIVCEKLFTALAVGNTVVAKPSPFTPLATLKLGEIWRDIVPPGVLNILAGGDETGAAMVAHPAVRMVSFTGSVAAGRQIAAAAGRHLKNVVLELGGNDAAIVLPDVDVAAVAPRIFGSAFLFGGQVCAAIKRLYVHESIFDEVVRALADLADQSVAAPDEDGGTLGPMTTKPQYERVHMLVEDAVAHGATVVAGGTPSRSEGYFLPATILTNVSPGMRVVDEEQFGPVLPVMSFRDVNDAVAQANATEYGLGGSVWTSDIGMGEAIAARLECGTTWINHHAEVAPHIPMGGMKQSGIGRAGGVQGTDAYAELQTQYVYKKSDRVLVG